MWKWEADGEAKAVVVIVHGALEHHRRYGWLIQMFRLSGFHVIMGDLPGQGLTTRTNRGHIDSFEEYMEEVKEWVLAAYSFDLPVFLLGHSMGGLITIRLMQEERLNLAGAILSSPCLGLVDQPSRFLKFVSHGLNKVVPNMMVSPDISVEKSTRNRDVRDADLNDSLFVTKVSVRWYRELDNAMEMAFKRIDATDNIPLLVLQGGDDKIVDKMAVRNWFNAVPLSEKRFKEWPSFYHEVFNEPEREDVFEYTKDFIISQLKTIGYIY